ncbi:hypothetical protein FQN57_006860 [Myotisia sp. PD_48]|nr:hypothetical protein FQN57_006860 [Myotisia sp. PD_48]
MAAGMSAAYQLLTLINTLHKNGIRHNALHPGNVLWDIASRDKYGLNIKYKHLGSPRKVAFADLWKKREPVSSIKIPGNLLKAKIFLSQFGISTGSSSKLPQDAVWPAGYCAPAWYHGILPDEASDM